MQVDKDNNAQQNQKEEATRSKTNPADKQRAAEAFEQAEADIEKDPDLATTNDPTADLDEGEIARLDNNDDNMNI